MKYICVDCGKEFEQFHSSHRRCRKCHKEWLDEIREDYNWMGQSCNEVDDCGDRE